MRTLEEEFRDSDDWHGLAHAQDRNDADSIRAHLQHHVKCIPPGHVIMRIRQRLNERPVRIGGSGRWHHAALKDRSGSCAVVQLGGFSRLLPSDNRCRRKRVCEKSAIVVRTSSSPWRGSIHPISGGMDGGTSRAIAPAQAGNKRIAQNRTVSTFKRA
jgi:hypothetical protein